MLSLSDGALGDWSTGVPYMYLTPMELSAIDIAVDSRVTFLVPSQLNRKYHTQGAAIILEVFERFAGLCQGLNNRSKNLLLSTLFYLIKLAN